MTESINTFGFGDVEREQKRYAGFHEDKIVLRHKTPLEGVIYVDPPAKGESDVAYNKARFRTRVTKNQQTNETRTIHEEAHGTFTGRLDSIRINQGDFGKQWEFGFKLPGEEGNEITVVFGTAYTGQYGRNLINRLCNLEPNDIKSSALTLQPYCFDGDFINEQTGKPVKIKGVTLRVGDRKIEQAYTKSTDPALPAPERIEVNGQEVSNYTKQMEFLNQHLLESVIPHLVNKGKTLQIEQGDPTVVPAEDVDENDVPF